MYARACVCLPPASLMVCGGWQGVSCSCCSAVWGAYCPCCCMLPSAYT